MRKYDLVVCGGGLSGIAAAIQAKRSGVRTVLLIERYGFLGGMATSGLINPFMPYWKSHQPAEVLIHGIFAEIMENMRAFGGMREGSDSFDAECMKIVLQRMVKDAGVDLQLHSFVEQVHVKNDRLVAVRVASKSAIEFLAADAFIDCTGDADVAALCGAPWQIGRDEDHQCQPMTLSFRMANVDRSRMPDGAAIDRLYDETKARGEITNPREDVLFFSTMQEDVVHFNTTRVVLHNPISVRSLTDAECEAREQVWEMAKFLINHVPGFEKSYVQVTGTQIGIRESRRIVGEYMLTKDDVMNQARFDDCVCRFAYQIDIHNPTGSGTERWELPTGGYYEIPYRVMVPRHIVNLLVAGRPVSSDHAAHSSLRVMPACVALGQAAGVAAAIKLKKGSVAFKDIDGQSVRAELERLGAF